jgi:hypothetical protein
MIIEVVAISDTSSILEGGEVDPATLAIFELHRQERRFSGKLANIDLTYKPPKKAVTTLTALATKDFPNC